MPDLGSNPAPSPETQWAAWKVNPTPEASSNMLKTLDPVITAAARTHVGDVNPIIKGRARSMTLDALQTYDPKRGKLSSHLFSHLTGLKRYAARSSMPVSVPERLMLANRALNTSNQQLSDELGREPTEDELADHSGIPVPRIRQARTAAAGTNEGTVANSGSGEFDPAVVSTAPNRWADLIRGDLEPVDQKILEYSRAGMPNQRIAAKLRLSPGRVSQRKAGIQALLDKEFELSPF